MGSSSIHICWCYSAIFSYNFFMFLIMNFCFCRFHLLAEFDEAKRSCRKRLAGHNRRRRKPQVDSMNSGSFMTTQQGLFSNTGTRFASFSTPRPEASWSGIIKSEDTSPYYTHQVLSNRQNFAGSTSSYSKEGRRFPFLHEVDQMNFSTGAAASLEIPVCQPLLKAPVAPPPPPPESSSSNKMFSDGQLTHMLDSDCALSLLSSPANSSSVVDVSRMVRPTEHIPSATAQHHLVPNLHFGSSSSWFACSQASSGVSAAAPRFAFPSSMQSEQLNNTALVPSSNDNEMNCQGIFHVGAEGSSDGTSPSLQFSWQ
uniref:Uncharacterized protein n=1 Tax=Avena sativa TaxID=4498 RepID=A0ACD5XTY0_AVESA